MFRSTEAAQIALEIQFESANGPLSEDTTHVNIVVVKPNGSILDPANYTVTYPWQVGSGPATLLSALATIQPAHYAEGIWTFGIAYNNGIDPAISGSVNSASCQWGGTIDLLCQGAEASQNAYGDTQSIKQAALGNCTFDPVTGVQTFWSSGDHFRLIDNNGNPVSDQKLATGRDSSTQ